jgi:hypothetical protein
MVEDGSTFRFAIGEVLTGDNNQTQFWVIWQWKCLVKNNWMMTTKQGLVGCLIRPLSNALPKSLREISYYFVNGYCDYIFLIIYYFLIFSVSRCEFLNVSCASLKHVKRRNTFFRNSKETLIQDYSDVWPLARTCTHVCASWNVRYLENICDIQLLRSTRFIVLRDKSVHHTST